MSNYAWIIDTDHIGYGKYNEAGTVGPSNAPAALLERLRQPGEGATFRMKDGDDELYYTGRLVYADGDETVTGRLGGDAFPPNTWLLTSFDEDAEGPLRDYGMPNAGAVTIQYRDAAGHWCNF